MKGIESNTEFTLIIHCNQPGAPFTYWVETWLDVGDKPVHLSSTGGNDFHKVIAQARREAPGHVAFYRGQQVPEVQVPPAPKPRPLPVISKQVSRSPGQKNWSISLKAKAEYDEWSKHNRVRLLLCERGVTVHEWRYDATLLEYVDGAEPFWIIPERRVIKGNEQGVNSAR